MIDSPHAPSPLERRVSATQALLDDWKGRPLNWKTSDYCGRAVVQHLRRMGHKPKVAKAGMVKSALGAKRALKRLGADNVGDLMDLHGFARIAPAMALPGDVLELPAEDELGCLTIALGNGRVGGWHPDGDGFAVLQPVTYGRAWRVEPL